MTGKSLWQQIKAVVECDQQIASLTEEISTLEASLITDEQQGNTQGKVLTEKQSVLVHLKKDIDSRELQAQELKEQETIKRQNLESVKNQKEYMSLEREIAALAQRRAVQEEAIIKLWYALEQNEDAINQMSTQQIAMTANYQKAVVEKSAKIKEIQEQLIHLQTLRNTSVQEIQPDLRTQYERMKNNVADPIVVALNGSCSACFYSIPAHDQMKLKKSQIVICRSCYRFIYFDEQEALTLNQAQY